MPYLAWKTRFPAAMKLVLLAVIEITWNVYPPTAHASLALNACHVVLLAGLLAARMDKPQLRTRATPGKG